ncbi:MAG: 3-hydroxyanthranilate 3,4-dioxygenase [Flavobacteriales bacterium]|nr:3-hydroxyanthranilate 3,4-dioxygenase [Flavobacteriales bacterium]
MPIRKPFNFQQWIKDHQEFLKPPVGNKCVYTESGDLIIMVVGGPNQRKDYHYNETEEFFYQIKGDITLKIQEEGKAVDIPIKEGEIFLLPAKVPHSPIRPADSVGLVIEVKRKHGEKDGLQWYCENCNHQLHSTTFKLNNVEKDFQPRFKEFYGSEELRTCSQCGTKIEIDQRFV